MFFVFLRITPNNKVQKSSYLARSRPHALENLPRFPDIPAAADVHSDRSFNTAEGGAGRPRHSLGPSVSYGERALGCFSSSKNMVGVRHSLLV